jgi:iron complex outermembrane receptor protein
MIKNFTLISISLIIFTFQAFAQKTFGTIQGELKDNQGNPVAFATVKLEGTRFGSFSNQIGVFSLSNVPMGDYVLVAKAIGYNELKQNVTLGGQAVRLVLEMQSSDTELGEILIQASKMQNFNQLNRMDVPAKLMPVTATAVGREIIAERNVDNLGEALKSVSSVRPMDTYGGFQTFTIRGFNNFLMMVDGVRDERHNISQSAPTTNLANVESIEVLKGPASVLFGHSALGGVINITRKQPNYIFGGEVMAAVGSWDTRRLNAGFGGPVNEKLRYRVDFGMAETEGFRGEGFRTNNAFVAFDYQPTAFDLIEFRFQANKDHYNTDAGLPVRADGSLHPMMDRRTRYNAPDDRLLHERYDFQVRYQRTFRNGMVLSNLLSYSDDDINYLSSEELALDETNNRVRRTFELFFNHETKPLQNQLELTKSFRTGQVEQKILAGYSLSIMDRKTFRGPVRGDGVRASISIVDPILNQGALFATATNYLARMENVNGFYVQNWLNISPKLKGLIGARYDLFGGEYFVNQVDANRNVTSEGDVDEFGISAFTWRGGLVYEISDRWSLYGSYSTYFRPTRRIAVDGSMFDPEDGYQGEMGTRYQLDEKLSLNASAFFIVRSNILENLGAGNFRNIGEGESKGYELDLEYRPNRNLNFRAGYANTSTQVRNFTDSSVENPRAGNALPFVPQHNLNSWINYRFTEGAVKGLGLSGGYFYNSITYTDAANNYALPAYGVLDVAVSYQHKKSEWRVNINNITDTEYFANAILGNQWTVGNPRNFLISYRTRF